jgi:hypothetical protein
LGRQPDKSSGAASHPQKTPIGGAIQIDHFR